MNKRGISPFIATVLLIGIVIITGVFLLAFYSSFSSNQTDEIEDQTYITRLCVEKTDLNLGKSCRVSYLTSTIRLDVENEGAYPISSVNFTFYFGTDVVGTCRSLPDSGMRQVITQNANGDHVITLNAQRALNP